MPNNIQNTSSRTKGALSQVGAGLMFAVVAGIGLQPAAVSAQDFPSRPITLIVPNAAGTTSDLIARIIAPKFGDLIGQRVVVENVVGAGAIVGTTQVAESAADGYTLGMLNSQAIAANVHLHDTLPYDPAEDFVPIGRVMLTSSLLAAAPNLPVSTVQELVEHAKNNPGQLDYVSQGNGSAAHLAGVYFADTAEIDVEHIPYNNVGQAFTDLMEGRASFGFFQYNVLQPFIEGNQIKVLATAGPDKAAALPDVPTVSESGYPGWTYTSWAGFFAPADVPSDVLEKISAAFETVMADPEVVERIEAGGTPVAYLPGEAFGAFAEEERERLGGIIRSANAQ